MNDDFDWMMWAWVVAMAYLAWGVWVYWRQYVWYRRYYWCWFKDN